MRLRAPEIEFCLRGAAGAAVLLGVDGVGGRGGAARGARIGGEVGGGFGAADVVGGVGWVGCGGRSGGVVGGEGVGIVRVGGGAA